MPDIYYLKDGSQRLEIEWKFGRFFRFKNICISLNGIYLSLNLQEEDLDAGWETQLQDGTTLKVKIAGSRIVVLQDGQYIPSWIEPKGFLQVLSKMILFYGGLRGAGCILMILGQFEPLKSLLALQSIIDMNSNELDLDYYTASFFMALVIICVGFFVQRQIKGALFFAIFLFVFDGFFFKFVFDPHFKSSNDCYRTVIAFFVILLLFKGIAVVRNHEWVEERKGS